MRRLCLTILVLLATIPLFASVQCLKGFDEEHCKRDGKKLLAALTPLNAEKLMPREWKYTIVHDRDWKELQTKLGAPSEYAISAPWLGRTFFRQHAIEGYDDDVLAFIAAHEMAHVVCSIPMTAENKANIVAHRLLLTHGTDVPKLCK